MQIKNKKKLELLKAYQRLRAEAAERMSPPPMSDYDLSAVAHEVAHGRIPTGGGISKRAQKRRNRRGFY